MNNWPVNTLGEVCDVVNGATPDTKVKEYWGGKHAWITPAEMGGLSSPFLSVSRRTLSDEGLAACSASLVPPESVILSSRAPIGHLVINKVPMATNQGCKSLIPREGLDFNFLYYYLKANVELLDSLGTGTTFKELSGTQLKTVEMPVPPLEEQKRIVELLDAATARITELTACYEQARTHANSLFTRALQEALEGHPEWPIKTLGEVCELQRGHDLPSSERRIGDVPILGSTGITGFHDVARYNGPGVAIGRSGFIGGAQYCDTPYWPLNTCLFVKDFFGHHPKWVYYFLKSVDFSQFNSGTSQPSLNRNNLHGIPVRVPTHSAQVEIVDRLDEIDKRGSEIVAAYDAKLTAAKNLRQSILEAAFAGDL